MKGEKFSEPHQYKTVNGGEHSRVYFLNIPKGMTGFIDTVANTWFVDTYLIWNVDGEPVEPKIEREIAHLNNPKKFASPIVVKHKIEWWAYNNSADTQMFEVICDGVMYE